MKRYIAASILFDGLFAAIKRAFYFGLFLNYDSVAVGSL